MMYISQKFEIHGPTFTNNCFSRRGSHDFRVKDRHPSRPDEGTYIIPFLEIPRPTEYKFVSNGIPLQVDPKP